jgi:hypothetical protein
MFFKCHNCGEGHNLANVIKHIDQKLHDRYLLERYKSSAPSTQKPKAAFDFKPAFDSKPQKDYLSQLTNVSDLNENHPARHYVTDRMIPENHFENLYLCDKFMEFVNKVKPQTFPFIKEDHPRLIIPFFDLDGKFFAFQGRAFGNEQPKYLTIKLKDNKQKTADKHFEGDVGGLENYIKFYMTHIFDVEFYEKLISQKIILLKNYFENKGIDYIIFNSLSGYLNLEDIIAEENTIIFDNEEKIWYISLKKKHEKEFGNFNNQEFRSPTPPWGRYFCNGHPSPHANKDLADLLYKKIVNNGWID